MSKKRYQSMPSGNSVDRRDFFRRAHRLADARDNVDFDFGNHRQPLQQRPDRPRVPQPLEIPGAAS